MEKIKLREFQDEDVKLLKQWLKQDYILKWYSEPDEWIREIEGRHEEFHWISHYIAVCGEKPIGFCQYYPFADGGEDWNGNIPTEGTYSLDYLIGEKEFLGRGFGRQIACLLTDKILTRQDAKRIIVHPEPENAASCNTLLSSGYLYDADNKLFMKNWS